MTDAGAGPRFLYRPIGQSAWVVATSAEKMSRGKGTIVSDSDGASPVGLTFRFYSNRDKDWLRDPTLTVDDATAVEAVAAAARAEAAAHRLALASAAALDGTVAAAQAREVIEEKQPALFEELKFRNAFLYEKVRKIAHIIRRPWIQRL